MWRSVKKEREWEWIKMKIRGILIKYREPYFSISSLTFHFFFHFRKIQKKMKEIECDIFLLWNRVVIFIEWSCCCVAHSSPWWPSRQTREISSFTRYVMVESTYFRISKDYIFSIYFFVWKSSMHSFSLTFENSAGLYFWGVQKLFVVCDEKLVCSVRFQ